MRYDEGQKHILDWQVLVQLTIFPLAQTLWSQSVDSLGRLDLKANCTVGSVNLDCTHAKQAPSLPTKEKANT